MGVFWKSRWSIVLERYLLMSFFDEERRKRLLIIVLAPIIFFLVIFMSVAGLGTTAGMQPLHYQGKSKNGRPTVNKYCSQYKIGEYTDLALALMQAEIRWMRTRSHAGCRRCVWSVLFKNKEQWWRTQSQSEWNSFRTCRMQH